MPQERRSTAALTRTIPLRERPQPLSLTPVVLRESLSSLIVVIYVRMMESRSSIRPKRT